MQFLLRGGEGHATKCYLCESRIKIKTYFEKTIP
jgi:hypothetical protein